MPSLPVSGVENQHKKTFQFPEIRIVEASAGSGKTYALAKRYIQLLLSAQDPAADTARQGRRPLGEPRRSAGGSPSSPSLSPIKPRWR